MTFASICFLLDLVAHLDLELFLMDVKSSSLDSNFEEEIYVDQLIGFISNVKKTRSFIPKGLYIALTNLPDLGTLNSMKQYHLANPWFQRTIVYVKTITREIMVLALYVDDILIVGNNLEVIKAT